LSLPEQSKRGRRSLSKRTRTTFLELLAEGYSVTHAANAAGVYRQRLYEARDRDEAFAAEWADAYERGTDVLRDELRRRALEGIEEPIVSAGKVVAYKRVYSDRLLELELKRRDPSYREKFVVEGGEPITFVLDSLLERARLADEAEAQRATNEVEGEILAIEDGESTDGC
jgi:hypothetical protein